MEESSDVKPAAFGKGEELAEEQEQRQDAEDDRQDHGGLDRLQPFWGKKHMLRQTWEWPGGPAIGHVGTRKPDWLAEPPTWYKQFTPAF